jgi:hypothetical protein
VNRETGTYAMSISEIAANLGISERAVRFILCRAIAKLRSQSQLCAGFCTAVGERRRALDARPGNAPWDYAGPGRSGSKGTSYKKFLIEVML